jgi:hypothetical protein
MPSIFVLEQRRERLVGQVNDHLDFLIGSISSKGLKYQAYNLTSKIDGKTKSRHIPIDMLPLVKRLTQRHRKLKTLLRQIDEVNWSLLLERVSSQNGTL